MVFLYHFLIHLFRIGSYLCRIDMVYRVTRLLFWSLFREYKRLFSINSYILFPYLFIYLFLFLFIYYSLYIHYHYDFCLFICLFNFIFYLFIYFFRRPPSLWRSREDHGERTREETTPSQDGKCIYSPRSCYIQRLVMF